jgi:radial spoke head protein 4A
VVEGDLVETSTHFDKFAMDTPGYNGANLKTYWVCSGAGAELIQLPNVTSEQIVAAKKIKKFFTGDLDAAVQSYPVFPGNEANLLRAQICRISVATTLIPAGVFSVAEPPEDEEEEFDANALVVDEGDLMEKAVPTVDLNNKDAWQYYYPGAGDLNAYGRCTKMPPKLDAEGEPIEDENEPEFKEPMASISEDDETPKWSLKLIKDNLLLKLTNSGWPGAVSVGYGQPFPKCVNFYAGYGFSKGAKGYNPPLAPPMQEEYSIPEEVDADDYFSKLTEHPDLLVDPNQEDGADE